MNNLVEQVSRIKSLMLIKESNITDYITGYIADREWFDKKIGSCAFFAGDFYNWMEKNHPDVTVKIVLMPQDEKYVDLHKKMNPKFEEEWHVVPSINNTLIDFTYEEGRGVAKDLRTKNVTKPEITSISDGKAFTPEGKYGKYGYYKPEIINHKGEGRWVIADTQCPTKKVTG